MGAAASERLTGLTVGELEAMADGLLAPARQARLDELLARQTAGDHAAADERELDRPFDSADQLAILKARARYTLHHLAAAAAAP